MKLVDTNGPQYLLLRAIPKSYINLTAFKKRPQAIRRLNAKTKSMIATNIAFCSNSSNLAFTLFPIKLIQNRPLLSLWSRPSAASKLHDSSSWLPCSMVGLTIFCSPKGSYLLTVLTVNFSFFAVSCFVRPCFLYCLLFLCFPFDVLRILPSFNVVFNASYSKWHSHTWTWNGNRIRWLWPSLEQAEGSRGPH